MKLFLVLFLFTLSAQAEVFKKCFPVQSAGYTRDGKRFILTQKACVRIVTEEPFFIHLEPNQKQQITIPEEAFIEPDAYCRVDGNIIRDEFSTGRPVALRYGSPEIGAGFRFPVNVKITFFRIEITSEK